jgi:hypothetical protein
MNNSDKIIQRIRTDEISPIPKHWFIIRKTLIWIGLTLFLIIGGISFSVILYTIQESSFDLFRHITHSRLEFILVIFPVLWLISLVIFLLASIWTIRFSKKGYKRSPGQWLLYLTALSIVLGTLFFIAGGARWFERSFANSIEIYESIEDKKIQIWSRPEEGLLSGTIEKVTSNRLEIRDFSNRHWNVNYSGAFIAPVVLLEPGETIKINGEMMEDNLFHATDIRPWGGRNNNFSGKNERKGKGPRSRG